MEHELELLVRITIQSDATASSETLMCASSFSSCVHNWDCLYTLLSGSTSAYLAERQRGQVTPAVRYAADFASAQLLQKRWGGSDAWTRGLWTQIAPIPRDLNYPSEIVERIVDHPGGVRVRLHKWPSGEVEQAFFSSHAGGRP